MLSLLLDIDDVAKLIKLSPATIENWPMAANLHRQDSPILSRLGGCSVIAAQTSRFGLADWGYQ